jgi:hypothetical protein
MGSGMGALVSLSRIVLSKLYFVRSRRASSCCEKIRWYAFGNRKLTKVPVFAIGRAWL